MKMVLFPGKCPIVNVDCLWVCSIAYPQEYLLTWEGRNVRSSVEKEIALSFPLLGNTRSATDPL